MSENPKHHPFPTHSLTPALRTELAHQLKISGARCIFTDSERLNSTLQAVKAVGLPNSCIVLVENGDQPAKDGDENGFCSMHDLLACAPYSWEVVKDREVLADKYAMPIATSVLFEESRIGQLTMSHSFPSFELGKESPSSTSVVVQRETPKLV